MSGKQALVMSESKGKMKGQHFCRRRCDEESPGLASKPWRAVAVTKRRNECPCVVALRISPPWHRTAFWGVSFMKQGHPHFYAPVM